jgi:serine/threonine protein kinase/Flp pilus assembly protein TadD
VKTESQGSVEEPGKDPESVEQEARTCPVCGTKFLATADREFCPVCILRGATSEESAATGESGSVSGSAASPGDTEGTPQVRRFEHYEVMLDTDGRPIELGRGAMGVTYKALDVDLRCPVTLKVISEKYVGDDSARLRFLREARAAAKVRHSNVASVLHLGRTGNSYFYAMEFVEGETLEHFIRRSGRVEVKLALEIVAQVAAGLAAVHEQNLVHRDIKPSNIMVRLKDDGSITAKIIDLGLAKGVAEAGTESAVSTPGAFAGTPAFASPEQFAGLGADIRSDLYSVGVTLWEMVAGQVPFGGSPSELMQEHQHAPLPLEQLKGLPQPVVVLLQVMLEKDPNQRFQSPAQLQQALTKTRGAIAPGLRFTADELRSASAEVTPDSSKTKPRKQTVGWVLGVGLCVAGGLFAWFFFFGHLRFFNQRSKGEAPEKSIAVLPFENISANKDDAYFADGVQDEILNNLAKVSQLKVISRTSVMKYRPGTERDLRQIASALGVANVLEGAVRRDGNHVRVSTELVDAHNDNTIWADSYDRDLADIFAIQSEIAQKVASRLSAQLSPEERKDIGEKPTDNLEAYDLYLQAKPLVNSVGLSISQKENYSKAISLLEQATQKDPKFALGFCLLAKAHDYLYHYFLDSTPENRKPGDAAVNEAFQLRPDLPEAHLAMASHLYICYRDFERASVQIAIAAKSMPNNPELLHLSALIDQVQGRWEKSIADLERAATLDLRNPDILDTLARTYFSVRRYPENERILERLIELEPDQPAHRLSKADSAFAERADLGIRALDEGLPPSMKDDRGVASDRVYYAICARDFAAAEEILSETRNEELYFDSALVPRQIWALWLEFIRGNHPTIEQFGGARERLYQKVEADPNDPYLLAALAKADVALGRTEEGVQEARRAMTIRPISEDALGGPDIATFVAQLYVWVSRLNVAFEQLNILIKIPGRSLNYGDLKTNPCWDPLRKDPRFDKLLAELAPKD